MLKEKMNYWKFKFSCLKLKRHHKKLVNHNIKTLKFCIHNINNINFPTTDLERETLTVLIDLYEKTVNDLNKDIERVKRYMREFEIERGENLNEI